MENLTKVLKKNNIQILKAWLTKNVYDIHSIIDNQPLFMWAVMYANCSILKWLVKHGINVKVLDNSPIEILIFFHENNYLTDIEKYEKLNYLLKQGADFAHSSFENLCTGNLDKIKENYAKDKSYIIHQDSNKRGLIHYAAAWGDIKAIHWLVETVKIDVNKKSAQGSTALHLAAQEGHLAIVEYLLETPGLKINVHEKTAKGSTALHFAAGKGHLAVVKYLLEKSELKLAVNEKTAQGLTALHIAAQKGHLSIVKCLLETPGLKVDVHEKTAGGSNTLHLAAFNGCLAVVKYLLETPAFNININEKTAKGSTALMLANESNKILIQLYLLEHQADISVLLIKENPLSVNFADNNTRKIADTLSFAKALNDKKFNNALELIRQVPNLAVNFVDQMGDSPLHTIIKQVQIGSALQEELVKELLQKGAKRYAKNAEQYYPIDIAKQLNALKLISLLQTDFEVLYERNISSMLPLVEQVLLKGFIPKQKVISVVDNKNYYYDIQPELLSILLVEELQLLVDSSTDNNLILLPEQNNEIHHILNKYELIGGRLQAKNYRLSHYFLSEENSLNLIELIKSLQYLNHIIFKEQMLSEHKIAAPSSDYIQITQTIIDQYPDYLKPIQSQNNLLIASNSSLSLSSDVVGSSINPELEQKVNANTIENESLTSSILISQSVGKEEKNNVTSLMKNGMFFNTSTTNNKIKDETESRAPLNNKQNNN